MTQKGNRRGATTREWISWPKIWQCLLVHIQLRSKKKQYFQYTTNNLLTISLKLSSPEVRVHGINNHLRNLCF